MTETLSPVIRQLEKTWTVIQGNHPELPDAVITSSRRRHKSESGTRAQHCANVWMVNGKLQAEVTVFGERLADGTEQVMQSLLHEATHAIAQVRGIKDTSNRNRFHNKKFADIAEELGLRRPEASGGPALGWSDCTITESTTELYRPSICDLAEAIRIYIPTCIDDDEEKAPKEPAVKAHCECPEGDNSITWAKWMQKKFENTGLYPILCAYCRQTYVPEYP